MKLFRAQIVDEDTDEVITQISSYSEEGLEEESGKSKWTVPARKAEEENKKEVEK